MEDITDWDVSTFIPEDKTNYFLNILETHKFYRNLKPKEHSIEVLERLNEIYDIVIVTDAFSRMGYKAKHDWLFETYPFLNREQLIFCADKSFINADYMIDDSLHHLENFQGVKVLMDAPHNQNYTDGLRVFNWRHIYDEFVTKRCQVCKKPLSNQFCSTSCGDIYIKEYD